MPATEVERLLLRLEVTQRQFERQMARAAGTANRTAGRMETRFNSMDRRMSASLTSVGASAQALIAGLGIREVVRYADTWTSAGNQIAAASQIAGRSARSLEQIGDIADETRSGIAETVNLYARLLRATRNVANSEEEVARATEIVNKAFVAGGAAASEQASGVLQLGQALDSGFLQGEELRAIRENAPLLAQAIADEFDTTIGGLRDLGAQAEITSDRVFRAILNAQAPIEAVFAETNATIGQSFVRLQNALTEFVGQGDAAAGTSQKIATALNLLADNIDIAVAAGIALGSRFIGPVLLTQLGRAVRPIRAAAVGLSGLSAGARLAAGSMGLLSGVVATFGGPLGFAITALTALPLVLTDSRDRIESLSAAGRAGASALESYANASRRASEEQRELGQTTSIATQRILEQTRIEIGDALREINEINQALSDDILGNGFLDSSEITAPLAALRNELEILQGVGGENRFLENAVLQLEQFQRGAGNVDELSEALIRVRSVGDEAFRVFDEFLNSISEGQNLEEARQNLVDYANATGIFAQELAQIENAVEPVDLVNAYQNLANSIFDAAKASEALSASGAVDLSDLVSALSRGQQEAIALQAAMDGNIDLAQQIIDRLNGAADAGVTLNNTDMSAGITAAANAASRLADNLALARAQRIEDALDFQTGGNPDFFDPRGESPTSGRNTRVAPVPSSNRISTRSPASSGGGSGGGSSGGQSTAAREAERLEAAIINFQEVVDRSNLDLDRQFETLGRSTAEIAGLRAEYELLDLAKRNDISLDRRIGDEGRTVAEVIRAQGFEVQRLTELYENNSAALEVVEGGFDDIASATADALTGGESLRDGFRNILRQIANDILTSGIREGLSRSFSPGLGGGSGGILGGLLGGLIPGFQRGTSFAPGGVALVGENGPELVNLPRGSQVIPNSRVNSQVSPATPSIPADRPIRLIVEATEGEMFRPVVRSVSAGVAVEVVGQNNRIIPGLVAEAQEQFG